MTVARHSALADLLRLAIPLALIAGAVAGALWIDRSSPLSDPATSEASAVASR
jgi:Na+/H+ antiporter NhaC